MRQCSACHCPNTVQYLAKKSPWHRDKNPLVWQKWCYLFILMLSMHHPLKQLNTNTIKPISTHPFNKWIDRIHLWVWRPQTSIENMQKMKEALFWGLGEVLGFFVSRFFCGSLWGFVWLIFSSGICVSVCLQSLPWFCVAYQGWLLGLTFVQVAAERSHLMLSKKKEVFWQLQRKPAVREDANLYYWASIMFWHSLVLAKQSYRNNLLAADKKLLFRNLKW